MFTAQENEILIVDRSKEHLGPGDRAIIHVRRLFLEAAEGKGLGDPERIKSMDYTKFKARDGLIPIDADWKSLYDADDIRWLDGGN
jgi:phthalate 4,5-dioxygenase oxygenase subunit